MKSYVHKITELVCVCPGADSPPLPCRHRDKDTEFVTLCKSLHVTDLVCENAWVLWKTIQDSVEELGVCITQSRLWCKPDILLLQRACLKWVCFEWV